MLAAYIVVLIVVVVLQVVLIPKASVENARPKGLGDFDVPTATEDRAIPITWGTVDITGPNVVWYGDLKTTKRTKTQGGNRILLAYNYWLGIDLILCYGPIDRVTRFEIGDKWLYPATELVLGVPTARITPAFPVTPTEAGTPVVFSAKKALGGNSKGGTIDGTMRMYNGGPNQTQNAYLQSKLGTNIPAYVNVAHIVGEQIQVGESSSVGAYVFRVTRFPDNLGLTGTRHIINGTIDDGDANPMEVAYEALTSDIFGLSMDPALVDIASFRAAGNILADEGNGMSWIITSVIPAADILKEVARQADAIFFEDSTGKFSTRLIRDDYTPAALFLFDEGNILKLNEFSRSGWVGSKNHVNIGYTDRDKEFQATGAMSQDLANVRIQGAEVRADYKYPGVHSAATAQAIAERELRVLSFPLAKIEFTTNRDGVQFIPGEVVRFSWSALGITDMVVRIAQVDVGDIDNGKVKIVGMQDVFRVAESLYKAPNATGWSRPSDLAGAFVAGEELVREMPRILGNLYPEQISDPTQARTWNFVSRPDAGPSTLDVEIFIDAVGAGDFLEGFGDIELVPLALIDLEYPAATADIETSDALSVDTTVDFSTDIGSVTPAQVAAGLNLVLIEGATQAEDEVIGFEDLIDDGDGTYRLRNAHRGLLDTQARTHAVGARVWLFAENVAYSNIRFGDLQAIDVRHVPSTASDTLAVFDATTLPLTFAQRTLRPHHPANFTVNATRVPVAVDETADLDFDWEHRLNGDLTARDAADGDATGQSTDVEYVLEFRNAVTAASLRTEVRVSPSPNWLTYLYTQALLQADTGEVGNFPLEARMHARWKAGATAGPALVTSLQTVVKQFNADMGGATVQSIDLDGTTEYLANTTAVSLGIANVWSINVWVRGTSSAGGTQRDIIHFVPAASNIGRISLVLTDDSAAAAFNVTVYNEAAAIAKDYDFGSFTVNTWTMLTVTWDGTNLVVYQDGVEQTPTLNTDITLTLLGITANRVLIGATTTPAASWVGQIFSPAVWTTELVQAEITAIDAGTSTFNLRENSGFYASRATLNHLWDFRTSANIGQDYRNSTTGTAVDVDTNSANITVADLNSVDVP